MAYSRICSYFLTAAILTICTSACTSGELTSSQPGDAANTLPDGSLPPPSTCTTQAIAATTIDTTKLWVGATSAVSEIDQTVTFTVQSPQSGQATVVLREDKKTDALVETTITLTAGQPQTVTTSLDHAGFLLAEVSQNGQVALAGASVAPCQIENLTKEPDDFDSFWNGKRQALATIPLNTIIVEVPAKSQAGLFRAFQFNLDQLDGRKVWGWLAIPETPGTYPAILDFPSAGDNAHTDPIFVPGSLTVRVGIQDFDNTQQPPQDRLCSEATTNTEDHTANCYQYAVVGASRILDYLYTRPDFDQTTVISTGKSQGGGLSIMFAGFDNRVTHLYSVVPAFGQHRGLAFDRSSGWPFWLYPGATSGDPAVFDTKALQVEYYETTNFAKRFMGKAHIRVGWIDIICPPSSIMPAYIALPGEKVIDHGVTSDHGWTGPVNWWQSKQEDLAAIIANP